MEPVVTVEHLKKCYGDLVAVDDVTFTVERGEIFGILGPNGSGKTTTVECLQGLRQADGGELSILGLDPQHDARELRRQIGSQLQESALPDRIRVGEALEFFSSLSPNGPPWRTVMAQWGLAEKCSATFTSLSGGQQQRLFVALAVVNAPQLVFLDEMTTGLDPTARRVAWELIRQMREQGTTVVLVTHFMDEAEELCDRLAIVDNGRVVALDTPTHLAALHAPPPTVTFTLDEPDTDMQYLADVEGVDTVVRTGCQVSITGHGPFLAYVAATLVGHGLAPCDLDVRRGTLEEAFLALTTSSSLDDNTSGNTDDNTDAV
ncbi:MAG TPA: ABC transporter ATP-binding protein [Ilumatobacteraceae bacterium]|nr:ABC transporter ATP-binding protein [Ilumatobacteraceae bacterium]